MKAKDHEKAGAILERIAKIEEARRTLYSRGYGTPCFAVSGMGGMHADNGERLHSYLTQPAQSRVAHAIEMELYGISAMLREELEEMGVTDAQVAPLRRNPSLPPEENVAEQERATH